METTDIALVSAVNSYLSCPSRFNEAWNHPIDDSKIKWRQAIEKELSDMENKSVWEKVKRNTIPDNKKIIGNKWVFKVKSNGTHRARLTGLGYSQIPGIDFSENYALVLKDATFRILIVIMLKLKLEGVMIDVETAFLYADLKHTIYMKCPEGYNMKNDECLLLKKTLYGLVQSAREWWRTFINILTNFGFTLSAADPCLMSKFVKNEIVIVSIYVDDCVIIGHTKQIEETKRYLRDRFKIKEFASISKYLGCEINFDKDGVSCCVMLYHIICFVFNSWSPKQLKLFCADWSCNQ